MDYARHRILLYEDNDAAAADDGALCWEGKNITNKMKQARESHMFGILYEIQKHMTARPPLGGLESRGVLVSTCPMYVGDLTERSERASGPIGATRTTSQNHAPGSTL